MGNPLISRLLSLVAMVLAVLPMVAGGGETADRPHPPVALARVDTVEITDADLDRAAEKLEDTVAFPETVEEWRARLQLLIDRQFLLLEARKRGFYDDPKVAWEVGRWERSRLIDSLLDEQVADTALASEEELQQFFSQSGAHRELNVGRLVFTDRATAQAAVAQARSGTSFAELLALFSTPGQPSPGGGTGWLNPLAAADRRALSLFAGGIGAAELIETRGVYLVFIALEERSVSLEDRRTLVEHALRQKKRAQTDLDYLESLIDKYQVSVDSSTVVELRGAAAPREVDPALGLVRSSLGEWTVGEYVDVSERLPAAPPAAPDAAGDLELRILSAYAVDQLLAREAREKGLHARVAGQREMVREQKAIEAMWAQDGLRQVPATQAELLDYFETHRSRYAKELSVPGGGARIWSTVVSDFKEERAAPLFEDYLADLRTRYQSRVAVEEDDFRAFVARRSTERSRTHD